MQITSRKGFTLIEILIVVAIIGILASVVIVGLAPTQRGGRDARRIADLHQVQTALELYYQKNQAYPPTSSWGDLRTALVLSSSTLKGVVGSIPDDPNVGNSTWGTYMYGARSGGYVLGTKVEELNAKFMTSSSGPADKFGTLACGIDIYCLTND